MLPKRARLKWIVEPRDDDNDDAKQTLEPKSTVSSEHTANKCGIPAYVLSKNLIYLFERQRHIYFY